MTYFFDGVLKDGKPFNVRRLNTVDISKIMALQDIIIQSLENKDILQPLSYDEFRYITDGNGILIGAFADNQLIAFRALLVPPVDEEGHLGLDIGLQENELRDVIYQEISNVHPDYRGNRLQQQLAQLIMQELKKQEQTFKYACATVMPYNIPSLKDKFGQGMLIAALKEKYEGRLRYVFYKELTEEKPFVWSETKELPMSDIEGQQQLLQQGWLGFNMDKQNGEYIVLFGK
ncbi:benzoate transport protein [Bacillus freudenreichii]|nr:benzoate transport protein [Bacillus freudenreichii]